uniref:Uncharacterized protein n=1 Tax=Heterorhabditis bacteriophora TaxID=37862 RepID=A0A1I7XRV5_HETBA
MESSNLCFYNSSLHFISQLECIFL